MSRDDLDEYVVRLERDNHRLQVELEQAHAQARTWRRVAQWIWAANLQTETPHDAD